jgi:hypothetical protein
MTPEEKLNQLLSAVKKVRENQKAYFKARRSQLPFVTEKLLKDSKDSEKDLDQLIQTLEAKENTQVNLF